MPFSTKAVLLVVSAVATAGALDTVRVRGTGVPAWGPKITLTRVLSVGQIDGPPEYAFGAIDGIAVDRWNRFYAFDAQYKQIRAYDANGKFLISGGWD